APATFDVPDTGFLVGSVPGCDLRLPGADLPPVLCLITRHAGGVLLRRLAPVQALLVNGRAVSPAALRDGDRVALGAVELYVRIEPAGRAHADDFPETDARQQLLEERTRELEADRALWYRRRDEITQECRQLQQRKEELTARLGDLEQRA